MTRSVTDEALGRLSKKLHELYSRFTRGVLDEERTLADLQLVIEGRVSDLAKPNPVTPTATWKDELVAMARRKLKKFSRAWADQVTAIPDTWTPEFLANAAMYNLKPVFFPDADINESFRKKGYTKPKQWFYDNVRKGEIKGADPTKLHRGWYLVDFTVGTDYTDGSQVFVDDPWVPLITRLRTELKLIDKYDYSTPLGSRFAIAWREWHDCLLAHMASKVLSTRAQTSLERAIEFNFIGNVYDPNRGRFAMREWFQDQIGDSCRLLGGNRRYGGLVDVNHSWHGFLFDYIAGRPLVRFVQ